MRQDMQILTSFATDLWYTPSKYIDLVKEVMGDIDLDPASDEFGNSIVKGKHYFNEEENGLKQKWFGRVFLNCPYGKTNGKSNAAVWTDKMTYEWARDHFSEGILLINNTSGYLWYENLWIYYPTCLVRERIRFIKPDGTQGGQAKRGSCFLYFGQNAQGFTTVFSQIGRVIQPDD
jgi:hypothetical protein